MEQLRPLKLTLAGVDKISAPVTRLTRKLDQMNSPIKRLGTSFRNLDRASGFKRLRGAAAGVGRELGALTRRAALLGTAMAAAGAAAINSFVNSTDEIAKTADFAGIGVEALQRYRFAFDRAGVSQEKADKGLIKLGKTIGELRAGTGTLLTILKKTNPEFARQLATTETSEQAFDLLIRKLAATENQMDRAALANAAFGRTGQLMANAVKDGIGPFEELLKRADELGFVLDEETVRKGEVAKDVFTDIGAVVKGLALSIGGELLPTILELSRGFLEWANANRDWIKTEAQEFVKQLVAGLRSLVEIARAVVPIIKQMVGFVGGLANVVKILATVILAKLIFAVGAFGAALLATPIGWFLGAIALLAGAAALVVKNWEPIKEFFGDLWAGAIAGFEKFKNLVPAFIRNRLTGGAQAAPAGAAASGGAAGNVLGDRAPNAAALLSPGGASSFAGRLDVSISQDRAPRVERLEGASADFDLGVETGLTLLPAGF